MPSSATPRPRSTRRCSPRCSTKVDAALTTIDSTVTTTLAPCAGTTATAQTTCANSFVSSFAQKAYRRPLDASEVTSLMKVYAQGAMQDYKTGIKLVVEGILISPSFLDRSELGAPSTPDATRSLPGYDSDALRDCRPARVHAAGQRARRPIDDGGRERQPGNAEWHRSGNRPADGGASGSGQRDEHRPRVVQHQSDVREDQGPRAARRVVGVRTGHVRNPERPLHLHAEVREQRALVRIGKDQRPPHIADGLRQSAARHAVSGPHLSGRQQGAHQRLHLRGGHLAHVAGPQRHADPTGLPLVGVGFGCHFDRAPGQGDSRLRPLSGSRSDRRSTSPLPPRSSSWRAPIRPRRAPVPTRRATAKSFNRTRA